MARPLVVDVPHTLDRAEVKRRMAARIGDLAGRIPGGNAEIVPSWPTPDRMALDIRAMGQSVAATLDVEDRLVRVTIALPMMLSLMAGPIEAMVRKTGESLLLGPPADHS